MEIFLTVVEFKKKSVKQWDLEYLKPRDILYFCIAYGLKCYSCILTTDPNACTKVETCPPIMDRCATLDLNGKVFFIWDDRLYFCTECLVAFVVQVFFLYLAGYITKSCQISDACISPIKCCKGDLCNSAISTGSSVLLLLVSSAVTSVFLWGSGECFTFFFPNL